MVRLGNIVKTAQLLPFACFLAAALLVAWPISDAATITSLQSSTLAWPLPVPSGDMVPSGWQAGGWQISSRFGWRDTSSGAGTPSWEFHDGIDLTGEPFCLHCPAKAVFDGQIRYLGWDQPEAERPNQAGGGLIAQLDNGTNDAGRANVPQHRALYAHLAPYRLVVQLQGRIEDPWNRTAYRHSDFQELGTGDLPAADAGIETSCTDPSVRFVVTQLSTATYEFVYDKPASCVTSVSWPLMSNGWNGWNPEEPTGQAGRVSLAWTTPIITGVQAGDVALRFRASITPPPALTPLPNATPTATPDITSSARKDGNQQLMAVGRNASERCAADTPQEPCQGRVMQPQPEQMNADSRYGLKTHSTGDVPAYETQPELPTSSVTGASQSVTFPQVVKGFNDATTGEADGTSECPYVGRQRIASRAPWPELHPSAAASFERVRSHVLAQTGIDALAELADVLRAPNYATDKAGVAFRSWHKAGRAIDLDHRVGWTIVADGRYYRLFLEGVDITAILEANGWKRIPAQGEVAEWWHYEYLPNGISWIGAMRQVWPLAQLQAELPEIAWNTAACGDSDPPASQEPSGRADVCYPGAPSWQQPVEYLDGCGPPVRLGESLRMLDDTLGFVGLTGNTSGPHLHLGLKVQSAAFGGFAVTDICTPPWLPPSLRREAVLHSGRSCWTDAVDPLDFLPRAHASAPLPGAQAAPGDSEPYQLPPPGSQGALLSPLPATAAGAEGEYWSPYPLNGRFGGGSIMEWLKEVWCALIRWFGFDCNW